MLKTYTKNTIYIRQRFTAGILYKVGCHRNDTVTKQTDYRGGDAVTAVVDRSSLAEPRWHTAGAFPIL